MEARGETNRICLSTSQQLRGGSQRWMVQLHDEIKRGFINAEWNTVFSPKASVESQGLMYTHNGLHSDYITCVLCTRVRYATRHG